MNWFIGEFISGWFVAESTQRAKSNLGAKEYRRRLVVFYGILIVVGLCWLAVQQ